MGQTASWSGLFSGKILINPILAAPECSMSSAQKSLSLRTTCHRQAQEWGMRNSFPKPGTKTIAECCPAPECFPSVWIKNLALTPRLGCTSKFCPSLKESFHSHTFTVPQLAPWLIEVLAPHSAAAGLLQGACAVPVLLGNLHGWQS